MTIPFKTFSKHLTEKAAPVNTSQFAPDTGGLKSVADSNFFGGVAFGGGGYAGSNSDIKDNPMYKYFMTNIAAANSQTKGTLGLLKVTPGLLSVGLDGDRDGGDETTGGQGGGFRSFVTNPNDQSTQDGQTPSDSAGSGGTTTSVLRGHGSAFGGGEFGGDEDSEEGDDGEEGGDEGEDDEDITIPGMNTDALYFGDPGEDEDLETIHKTTIANQKVAQKRWQQLKMWTSSFGVDSKVQAKIAGSTAIVGINAPAVHKHLKSQGKIKEQLDLKEKHANGSGPPPTTTPPAIPPGASSPTSGIRYMTDIADFSTWEHPEKDNHSDEHPIMKYFNGNIDAANNIVNHIMTNYMKNTPGQEVVHIDGEKSMGKHSRLANANTHNLHFGNVGHADEKNEVDAIYQKALSSQKDAQVRWKTLKGWMSSLTTDPVVAGKIADVNAVLGVNTPAVMRDQQQTSKKDRA